MKLIYNLAVVLLGLNLLCACSDDIDKVEEWPEWPAKADLAVNGQKLDNTFYSTYQGISVNLTKGQTVDFSGVAKLRNALQSHYWEVTSESSATFKGPDGEYNILWDHENSVIYTENAKNSYPDALYIAGVNWGHQGASKITTKGWSADRPCDMMSMCKTADNVFECSVYLAEGFNFKFFKIHTMGPHGSVEIWSSDLTLLEPEMVGGNSSGDFTPGLDFQPGIYNLVVDLNNNTLDLKTNMIIEKEEYFVDSEKMTPSGSWLHVQKQLTPGQEVVFGNFGGIEGVLQPDLWTVTSDVEGKAVFNGVAGVYDIFLDANLMIVFTESPAMNLDQGTALWVAGLNWGHPGAAPRVTSTGWDLFNPALCNQMKKVSDGVFEITLWLPENFDIKFFRARDWNAAPASTTILDPKPEGMFIKGSYVDAGGNTQLDGDLRPGPDYVPSTYTIRADFNRKIVYAVGHYNP
jgi:hypothetical protein